MTVRLSPSVWMDEDRFLGGNMRTVRACFTPGWRAPFADATPLGLRAEPALGGIDNGLDAWLPS